MDPRGYFYRTIRHGTEKINRDQMAADVVAAARRLAGAHHDLGAIVLECANMPPYRKAVELALELPVFDAAHLVACRPMPLGMISAALCIMKKLRMVERELLRIFICMSK